MSADYGFSKNLNCILDMLKMNQSEFAKRTGLTQAAVSQLLSNKRDPSLSTIVKILKVIPVKFEALVNLETKEK